MNETKSPDDGELLASLVKEAVIGLEFRCWGGFFPFQMATWRLIVARRPGLLDPLDATFADPPQFRGRGATWFCDTLAHAPDFLDREEKFMYWLVAQLPAKAKARGCVHAGEVPAFNATELRELARVTLAHADRAKAGGRIESR